MCRWIIFLFVITFALAVQAGPITYQGQLQDSSGPADTQVEIVFELYEQDEDGSPIATDSHDDIVVIDGLFQVELDFGNGVFDGGPRWLEVIVDGQELAPRQRITAAPVAVHTLNVPTDNLEDDFWKQGGNAGTDPASDFLGTSDAVPFEIRVDGQRVLRLEPADDPEFAPNWIGGHASNEAQDNAVGATIAGGGTSVFPNLVSANFGTISGGRNNTVSGTEAVVGGGRENFAIGTLATVGGGFSNYAGSSQATIGGGTSNFADGEMTPTVAGGLSNVADGHSATIGGGFANMATADFATISGGGPSDMSNPASTRNVVYDHYGTIGGGASNHAGVDNDEPDSAQFATVGGGRENTASGTNATVGGGAENTASSTNATVGGGGGNTASSANATVGGGLLNTASGQRATIGGGSGNTALGHLATIGGGGGNFSGPFATVGGGGGNSAGGIESTVPGGRDNEASGSWSFAAGRQAKAEHDGTFVWGDSTEVDFASTDKDQFLIRAGGGMGINTNDPNGFDLAVDGSAAKPGGGSWSTFSDARLKQNIEPASEVAGSLLERLLELTAYSFEYTDEAVVTHLGLPGKQIGLLAQEVREVFPEWVDTDEDGYLYVTERGTTAIMVEALRELSDRHDRQMAELRDENAELREIQDEQLAELRAENADLREQIAANSKLAERNANLEDRLAALEALLLEDRQVAESQQ